VKSTIASTETHILDLAQEIDRHLNAIRQRLREPLETEFAKGCLTGPQRIVMQALLQSEGLNLKELSAGVGLAHSTVSGILDRLQARGLVTRLRSNKDRRTTLIHPSAEVKSFREQVPALAISPLVHALGSATPLERATILKGLEQLRALVDPAHRATPRNAHI
jgi:DNA-binding MarR family transcriptional regulator